jgi:hypothetical protein
MTAIEQEQLLDVLEGQWQREFNESVLRGMQMNNKENKLRVLVLSTPRSGSGYFCSKLRYKLHEIQPAGDVITWRNRAPGDEFWVPDILTAFLDKFQLTFDEYFEEITKQEIFIAKCHLSHLLYWEKLGHNIFEKFDLVCYLEREDKIAQAKSQAIANKTRVWNTYAGKSNRWGTKYVLEQEGIEIPDCSEDEISIELFDNQNVLKSGEHRLKLIKHVYQFESYTKCDDQIDEFAAILGEFSL